MHERRAGHLRSIHGLCASALVALALVSAPATDARDVRQPERFAAGLDGGLVQLEAPVGGGLWSAWTYRLGGESDVALSVLDGRGVWSDPVFLGAGDGRDQVEPALAADAAGRVYVVFSESASGALMLSVLGAGAEAWSAPLPVPGARGQAPAVRVVGDLLVIGYHDGERTRLVARPLGVPGGAFGTHTIYDGPDPVGSCADDGSCPSDDDDERRKPRSDSGDHDSVVGFTVFEVPEELEGSTSQRSGRNSQHP